MAIELLPPQLANQIAAGEVVERPASVVKELVENSLDAGATRVDIDIEKGGSKLIRIRDNGCGIAKEELNLALSRHATSKVHTLDDLEAILSFGFRGEALASVSSVSRLTLTSRTAEQTEAWQAFAEGSQMAVKVVPAAHPQGSTIEVADLFFNTPARRRFLKSDKTEFTHIDEWLKRIAMSRTDIHFVLTHNGKRVRQYKPANTDIQLQQRIAQVSGKRFAELALEVSCEHEGLKLSGFIQSPQDPVQVDTHYFYVNGRLVRDRLVNHAVKQAFAEHGYQVAPAFILKLDLDPHQVDVNVHPAKHEVRFHQARYVHDYILQALQSVLGQMPMEPVTQQPSSRKQDSQSVPGLTLGQSTMEQVSAVPSSAATHSGATGSPQNDSGQHSHEAGYFNSQSQYGRMHIPSKDGAAQSYTQTQAGLRQSSYADNSDYGDSSVSGQPRHPGRHDKSSYSQSPYRGQNEDINPRAVESYAKLLSTPEVVTDAGIDTGLQPMPDLLDERYWVKVVGQQLLLLDITLVSKALAKNELLEKLPTGLVSQPLLMPTSVAADSDWLKVIADQDNLLRKMAIEVTIRYQQLIIKKVPQYLREAHLANIIPELLQWFMVETPTDEALSQWIVEHMQVPNINPQSQWQALCELSEQKQQVIWQQAKVMPWQQWLKEQTSDN
ncbi:DNA mismatch repair endonuclease MutL [Shewanella sp. WXL01]|uniref:DNA mismatch repair endonuclease MutL n=1 Tax=Shewanella sp. WXL01 TaxID=2709721 RepID=UPI0014382981|nr:DNA mismatch repair endonuclease MutL [Shewanella sp. WXL01]NKF49501.1 DNA mismatch repair endonuclease MutL [Shewanella sp. WXL01]